MPRQVPTTPSALPPSSEGRIPGRSPDLVAACPFRPPTPILNVHLRTSCVTSHLASYGALVPSIFVSTPVPLSLFCLPSLVRAKDPRDAWACRVDIRTPPLSSRRPLPQLYHKSLHILTVTYTILQLLRSSFQESMGC